MAPPVAPALLILDPRTAKATPHALHEYSARRVPPIAPCGHSARMRVGIAGGATSHRLGSTDSILDKEGKIMNTEHEDIEKVVEEVRAEAATHNGLDPAIIVAFEDQHIEKVWVNKDPCPVARLAQLVRRGGRPIGSQFDIYRAGKRTLKMRAFDGEGETVVKECLDVLLERLQTTGQAPRDDGKN